MTDFADIERRLRQLEDQRAIMDLKYRYFIAADRHDVPTVRDCFAPDGAVIEFEGFPRCESRDQLAEMMNSFGGRQGFYTMHHGHNPQIELTGPDTARGVWALYFSSIDTNAGVVVEMGGEYHEQYVRQDGRWYIKSSSFVRQYYRSQQMTPQALPRVIALGTEANTAP